MSFIEDRPTNHVSAYSTNDSSLSRFVMRATCSPGGEFVAEEKEELERSRVELERFPKR